MTDQELMVERVRRQFWPLICEQAQTWGLTPELVGAVVCQESGGNPNAMRVEPKWQYHNLDLPRPRGMSRDTEWWGQATSWGLMQVMGTKARELRFEGWWPALCQPDLGLYYGAKALGTFLDKANGDQVKALLRYNGGGNKQYSGQVLVWAELFRRAPESPHAPWGA